MSHLISKSSLLLFLSSFIIQSCTLSIPNKVQTEYSNLTEEIDFNYHIKPILSDRCFQCHGPDSKTRKAGLRLDIEEIAFSKLASGKKISLIAIVNKTMAVPKLPEILNK